MRARLQRIRDFSGGNSCANGKAAAKRFGERENIRLHSEVLIREKLTRSSHTGLYLIEYEKDILFVTKRTHCLQIFYGKWAHATFALDRLQNYCNGFRRNRTLHRGEIVKWHPHKSLRERPKTLADPFLT